MLTRGLTLRADQTIGSLSPTRDRRRARQD